MPQLSFHTPLGALTLSEEDGAIVALDWGFGRDQGDTFLLRRGRDQLQAYFDGEGRNFDLPLAPAGSPYRRRVWAVLQQIPFGQTRTYAEIASIAGGSARSVGGANAANPIPILIPCHRVVGASGLGGYYLEGGSWEGHTTFNPASAAFWSLNDGSETLAFQYGKIGTRCSRPVE